MKTDVIQKAFILNSSRQVLVLKRSRENRRKPGQLDLPGGFLDPQEKLDEGIRREIKEETGLETKTLKLVFVKTEVRRWQSDDQQNERNSLFLFYVGNTDTKDVALSTEHESFEWRQIEEVIGRFEDPILNELTKHIKDNNLLEV